MLTQNSVSYIKLFSASSRVRLIQGGPAKVVRPTYIFMLTFECIGKIQYILANVITVIQAHTLGSIKV